MSQACPTTKSSSLSVKRVPDDYSTTGWRINVHLHAIRDLRHRENMRTRIPRKSGMSLIYMLKTNINSKVKCDRQDPSCSNCTLRHFPALIIVRIANSCAGLRSNIQCEYRAPLPRGPRKRKYPPEEDLHIRLEHYEELLKSFGIVDPANTVMDRTLDLRLKGAPATTAYRRALPLPDGKVVISEQGKPRYIEK